MKRYFRLLIINRPTRYITVCSLMVISGIIYTLTDYRIFGTVEDLMMYSFISIVMFLIYKAFRHGLLDWIMEKRGYDKVLIRESYANIIKAGIPVSTVKCRRQFKYIKPGYKPYMTKVGKIVILKDDWPTRLYDVDYVIL